MRYSHRANTLMRVVGLLEAMSGAIRVWDFPRVTADRLARCFKEIGFLYPRAKRSYLVIANWPVHLHPKALEALAAEPRIQVIPLPTYAPWLNAIEKLWRLVKQRVTHAHPWCDDFRVFRDQVMAQLLSCQQGSQTLLRYVGLYSQ